MTLKRMADLKRRLFVSSIVGAFVTLLILFSSYPVVSFLLLIFVSALAAVGVWEYAQLAIAKGMRPPVKMMMYASVAQVIALYAYLILVDFPQLPILVLAIAMIAFFLSHFNETSEALPNIAVAFFGVAYVAVPLSLMLGILYPIPHQGIAQEGRWWLFYLIFVTKITDVGAYFVGKLWGKHQLSPTLSPKKTVEGAIAGFACAVLASCLLSYCGDHFFSGHFYLSLSEALWLGMLIGIFGQIGDLAESLLKRDAVVKDSNALPGLGGVLDMVDSLLLTAPIVYFFIHMH